jgi:hypothetical protein
MQLIHTSSFLRRVLFFDAISCAASGLLMIFGSEALGKMLEIPITLLFYAGLSLLPFAAFLVYLARRESLPAAAVWTVIMLNALWTVDSILILLAGWVTPTELGSVFVLAQALLVAMLAGLEYFGLQKSNAATA